MRSPEEIEQRYEWAIERCHESAARSYAQADPDTEEDWLEWFAARERSLENFLAFMQKERDHDG